ncbi:hypothetical protein [Kitasatospora brasiliensis]|uniref:hypothetical protein n=1 Tax=Kitasatospora brasiliensis TaxID=3058040 RepID=UPI00292CB999|nr:hypothetical protein [Kitasatospora sp. K002]
MSGTEAPRPRTEPRRGSVPLTTALALAAPLSLVGLTAAYGSYGWPAGLGVLVVATAALSAGLGRLAGRWRGCLAVLIVPFLLFIGAAATKNVRDDLTLNTGSTVTAHVTDKERTTGTRAQSWDYALAAPDGTPVPGGRLNQRDQDLRIGDQVTVRYAPDGTARPKRPEQIDLGTDLFWAGAVLLGAALAVVAVGVRARPAGPLRERLTALARAARVRASRLGAVRTALVWGALSAGWLALLLLARHTVGGPLPLALFLLHFLALVTCAAPLLEKPTAKPAAALLGTGTGFLLLALFL